MKGAVAAKGVDGLAGAESGLLTGLKLDETLKTIYKVKIAGDTTTNVEDNKCPKLDTEKDEKLLEISDGGAFSHEISFPAADAPDDEKNCKYTISVVPAGTAEPAGWENTKDVYAFTVKQQKTSDKITVKGTGSGDAVELKKGTAASQDGAGGDAIKFEPKYHAAVFDLNKDKSGGDPSWDKAGADKAAKVVALTEEGGSFKKLSEGVEDPFGNPAGKAFAGWYTAAENGDKLASASKDADVSGKTKLFAHYAELVKVKFLKEGSTQAEGDAVVKTIEVAKGGDLKSKKADIPTDATSLCVDNAGGKTVEKRLTGWKKLENGSATGSEVTTESLTDTSAPTFDTGTSYVAQCQKRPVVTFKNSDNTIDGKVELVVDADGKLAESDIPGDNSFCTSTGQVFKGWKDNTGSGLKSKADLKAETFDRDVSYIASCAAPSVTFKAGTGGNFSRSSTEKPVDIVDDSVTVPNGSDEAKKNDRVLMGWRLTKKGESSQAELNKVYKVGNDNKLEGYTPADGDELTAVWGVKVKFNSNADTTSGGSAVIKFKDGKPDATGDVEYVLVEEDTTIPTELVPGNKLACVKNGTTEHAVKQWNTGSGGSAAAFVLSTKVNPNSTDELVLTAECAEPITVKFNPNKGDFVKDTQGVDKGVVSVTVGKGGTITPLDGAKALIREGYKFAKWCDGTGSDNATSPTKADGTVDNGTCDTASSFATLDAGKTVFAVWTAEADKKIEYYDSKGKVSGATAVATDSAVKYNSVPTKKDGKDEYCKDSGKPVFDYWTLNSNNEATPAQYKFEERVTDDVELRAVCKAKAADPTPAPNPSNPSVTPGGSGSGSGSTGGSTGGSYFGGGSFGGGSSTPSTPAKDKKDDGKKKPGDKKQQPVVNKFDKQFTKKLDLPKNAVVRSAGQDRVATSLAALSLAKNHDTVVLATGSNFPDALTGGALAGALKAGVVLTTSSTLEQSVVNALKAQGTKTVYIVGGQSVVSAAKEAALRAAGFQVVRLAGADRYETAALVKAETLKKLGGKAMVSCNATGANFPDALACASAASLSGGVVDLVRPGQSVAADKVAGKTICAGGSACAAASGSVTKVVGSDRYETAYKLAEMTPAKGKVMVANGQSYADSLVAGALAGSTGANLVLSNAKRVNVPAGTTSAHLFGGNAVLPDNLPMYTK
ncbi:cell wall-binding repeat-containing protein [Mobiluncus mulieris]|uniref:cell wall-binding repeat-containing protein n=1 Tax=Mobiluncus mulieris TaxID=2052 RepID=UPI0032119FFA